MGSPEQPEKPSWWTTDEWTTPQDVVDHYVQEFGPFDLDPAARADTCKAAYYFDKDADGLQQPWFGQVWVNPPYSDPAPWCKKAVEEVRAGRAIRVVMLLPANTDVGWFHDWVVPYAETRLLRGRIAFVGWQGTPIPSPRQGNIIAVYRLPLTGHICTGVR